jgi:putative CocE/NonD family hydrolase
MRRLSALLWAGLPWLAAAMAGPALAAEPQAPPPKYPELPSEIPDKFVPATQELDYVGRRAMVPMRDGVRLFTLILVPKGAKGAPIILERTPYDATEVGDSQPSVHMGQIVSRRNGPTEWVTEGGYIRVYQDVRGKHRSEGDYVMNRPIHGPQNPTPVDHATDTYDTIDWLVRNLPESNGRVGILGVSYDGFLTLMALVNPHPALKVAVAMAPMVDGWRGDDWFHYGAFRQLGMSYYYGQESARDAGEKWLEGHYDKYDEYLAGGSAGDIGRRHGLEQMGMWRKVLAHPSYDAFWRDQAVDRVLAAQPLRVPVMLVHGLWDQEDIYGAPAVYKALKPRDPDNSKVFLVLGPWHHGQEMAEGSGLGELRFGSDTALYFRRQVMRPFLDQYLRPGAPAAGVAPVTAFETGTNRWLRLPAWPAAGEDGRPVRPTPLYLRAGMALSFKAPAESEAPFDEYVSDPAKPVPFIPRPVQPDQVVGNFTRWRRWLADDQRDASGRTDVLAYETGVLEAPVKVSGAPVANLVASTSGTDSDWVVKLIDVYPDEVPGHVEMGGYQLMVSADIFRGRYRESLETPHALASGEPLLFRFDLPNANHVFLPGHRIMVQVQSSWFPLYDRNPQTFVPNIFWAKPDDYRKAAQRVYHAGRESSFVELPLAEGP